MSRGREQTGSKKLKVMFLCTGNSCRSQMAEGWARHLAGDWLDVYSAGLEPKGLNPLAVDVMREAGVDISGQTSDPILPDLLVQMDWVITLCGDAEERCPVTPPHVARLHWPFPDPARVQGTPEEVRVRFREVRDGILRQVQAFLRELVGG